MLNSLPPLFWNIVTLLGSGVAFFLIFSVIVLVHEWGHFTAARLFGVRVEEFGLGLPPKARKLWKRGDTEYTLNWLPLGGFVRLYGESDGSGDLAQDPASFSSKPVWQRIVIAAAGVFMNFVLAFLLLAVFFVVGGRPLAVIPDDVYPFAQQSLLLPSESTAESRGLLSANPDVARGPYIEQIVEGSLAEAAGIEPQQYVTALNVTPVNDTTTLVSRLAEIPENGVVTLTLSKDGEQKNVTLQKTETRLGIVFAAPLLLQGYHLGPIESLGAAAQELGVQTTLLVEALGNMGREIAQEGTIPDEVGGPVKIAEAVHMANLMGLDALLVMAILLSVNLGVLNILPIPALDGGRIFFLLIEGITRKRIKPLWEAKAHLLGYALLMLLMIIITGRDILQVFGL